MSINCPWCGGKLIFDHGETDMSVLIQHTICEKHGKVILRYYLDENKMLAEIVDDETTKNSIC